MPGFLIVHKGDNLDTDGAMSSQLRHELCRHRLCGRTKTKMPCLRLASVILLLSLCCICVIVSVLAPSVLGPSRENQAPSGLVRVS